MRLFVLVALALFGFSAKAEPFKLTILQIANIQQGLSQMDSYPKIVDGKTVMLPFNFSGSLRMRIGRDIAACRDALTIYNQESRKLFLQMSGGKDRLCPLPPEGKPDPGCELQFKFNELNADMQNAVQEIGMWGIGEAELKLDENPIPSSALSLIAPIIVGPPK
jgi:hypothetical protein